MGKGECECEGEKQFDGLVGVVLDERRVWSRLEGRLVRRRRKMLDMIDGGKDYSGVFQIFKA